jgi:hypothetical protein
MVIRNRDVNKRMNYFDRQFLRAQDFTDEQDYHIDRRRRHNKFFHSAGVANLPDGLKIVQRSGDRVTVQPGWAVDEEGREMVVLVAQDLTITRTGAGFVEIYISYPEPDPLSDESTDPGTKGFTRIHEQAGIVRVPGDAETQPPKSLWLATVNVDGSGNIIDIADRRQPAGVATGNIGDDAITSAKIAEADGTSDQDTEIGRGIKTDHIQDGAVNNDKIANNTIQTDKLDPALRSLIETGGAGSDAILSAMIAEADGTSGQDTNAGMGIKTGHLQDQAVTAAKLQSHPNDNAQRAVGGQHIQTGSVSITQLKIVSPLGGPVFDSNVQVPDPSTSGGRVTVSFQATKLDEQAFYLISLNYVAPPPDSSIDLIFNWTHQQTARRIGTTVIQIHQLVIQNLNILGGFTAHCRVYRLAET